jgi:CheY-like chemotaxis protein
MEEIRGNTPALVFADVQMPWCGGFDLLESLSKDLRPLC